MNKIGTNLCKTKNGYIGKSPLYITIDIQYTKLNII